MAGDAVVAGPPGGALVMLARIGFAASILLIGVLVVVAWVVPHLHVAPDVLLVWGSGALCLCWLLALVTVPWNLHFRARGVLQELARVAARGVRVDAARVDETRRIVRRTLSASIGAHAVSAGVLFAIAHISGRTVWSVFAAFFLLAVAFRPGFEYFRYLRGRLTTILADARYPFEDVATLVERVDVVEGSVKLCHEDLARLREAVESLRTATSERDDAHDRRLSGITRRFEDTLDRLGDQREIVAGLKAFLRLVRAEA